MREVAEETGLVVEVTDFVGEVVRPGPDDTVYRIRDFRVVVIGGAEVAGDDATAVAWVLATGLGQLPAQRGTAYSAAVVGRLLVEIETGLVRPVRRARRRLPTREGGFRFVVDLTELVL